MLTGRGEVPVRRQVEALARSGYRGFYNLEWEKPVASGDRGARSGDCAVRNGGWRLPARCWRRADRCVELIDTCAFVRTAAPASRSRADSVAHGADPRARGGHANDAASQPDEHHRRGARGAWSVDRCGAVEPLAFQRQTPFRRSTRSRRRQHRVHSAGVHPRRSHWLLMPMAHNRRLCGCSWREARAWVWVQADVGRRGSGTATGDLTVNTPQRQCTDGRNQRSATDMSNTHRD